MGRPSTVSAEESSSEGTRDESRKVLELLTEYLELLAAAGNSKERQVGRVKQWLSLASIVNPALSPVFEHLKRIRDREELQQELLLV